MTKYLTMKMGKIENLQIEENAEIRGTEKC